MQSEADQSFRYILTYQDHFTKFVSLRALESKKAVEVADKLMDIFCERGSPTFLHSDNGKEFQNQVCFYYIDFYFI
jgi:transposase InsO family protein